MAPENFRFDSQRAVPFDVILRPDKGDVEAASLKGSNADLAWFQTSSC